MAEEHGRRHGQSGPSRCLTAAAALSGLHVFPMRKCYADRRVHYRAKQNFVAGDSPGCGPDEVTSVASRPSESDWIPQPKPESLLRSRALGEDGPSIAILGPQSQSVQSTPWLRPPHPRSQLAARGNRQKDPPCFALAFVFLDQGCAHGGNSGESEKQSADAGHLPP
jgi:hypothetical protein